MLLVEKPAKDVEVGNRRLTMVKPKPGQTYRRMGTPSTTRPCPTQYNKANKMIVYIGK